MVQHFHEISKSEPVETVRPARIFLCEDDPIIRLALEDAVMALGHECVFAAKDRYEALAEVTGRDDIDLAILDVDLSGSTSTAVKDALNALHIPFILFTGFDESQLEHLGFDVLSMRKPARPEKVVTFALEHARRQALGEAA